MELHSYDDMAGLERENWWYVSRGRVIRARMKRYCSTRATQALDVGCGVGSNYAILREYADNILGVDLSPEALHHAKTKGYSSLLQSPAEHIPLPDESFSLILCADVLEHTDDHASVRELSRLLSPGGMLFVTVPAFPSLWHENDDYSHHRRRYRKEELSALFLEAGFLVREITFWNRIFFPLVWLIARVYQKKEGAETHNNLSLIPPWLDRMLSAWMACEEWCARYVPLPFGVSLIAVLEKPKNT